MSSKKKSSASEAPESPQNASDNKVKVNTGTDTVEVSMDELYHNYQGVKPASAIEWEKNYRKELKEAQQLMDKVESIIIQEVEDMGISPENADLSRGIELVENVMSVIGDVNEVSADEWAGYIMMGFKNSYREIEATRLAKKMYPKVKESKNGTLWVKKNEK